MEKKILDQVPCFLVDDLECSMRQDGSVHKRRTAQVFLTGSQIGCFRPSPAPDPFIHPPVPIFQRIRQPTNGRDGPMGHTSTSGAAVAVYFPSLLNASFTS